MKFFFALCFFIGVVGTAKAQVKYYTKSGKISFFSKSPLENIEAVNNKVISVWDVSTGKIEFAVLMKGFEFEKALMQEHFNENYVESDTYPKAIFKGTVENSGAVTSTVNNTTTLKVTGTLSMHGVTNPVAAKTLITVKNGVISASCNFSVLLADYKITIPSLVADKINKKIEISISIPAYLPVPSR